ncbi:MAG: DUF72 domain-containing protein [bacterium]
MILIGTSGFSYNDWKGVFYPEDIKQYEMLEYYSRHFGALEINYSYYSLPSVKAMSSFIKKSNGRVRFSVKAHRDITHSNTLPKGIFNSFKEGIRPLTESGLLEAILIQFPWSFKPTNQALERITDIRSNFDEFPLAVEFRNSDWDRQETVDLLKGLGLAYCIVDEPRTKGLMPYRQWITSEFSYFRFHGRNSAKWYNYNESWERYDYLYSKEELLELSGHIRKVHGDVPKVLVFFNNHPLGKAVKNARELTEILSEEIFK